MLTNPVPGTAAQVLSAVLRQGVPGGGQGGRATFSLLNLPDLPELATEVVWLPQYALLDANGEFTGMVISQGWATKGVTAVTAAYTPQPSDAVILCNATGGAFTVTLPDATQPGYSPGQRYTIVKTDSSANAVTVNASAGQLIAGGSSVSLTTASAFTSVVFDGVNTNNWWIWAASATSSGSPSGPAGGSLTGTYPNPGLVTATTSVSGAVTIATATPQATSTGGATGSASTVPRSDHVHAQDYGGTFGDGSDGSVTLDGSTTFNNFSSLASSTYTLTRDVFATNLTINNGVTLVPNGWRVFCAGTFTVNSTGTVNAAGNAGTAGGTAGAVNSQPNSIGNGKAGGGGATAAGTAGGNTAGVASSGGGGGTGSSGAGGTAGTTGSSVTAYLKPVAVALTGVLNIGSASPTISGGSGGGGGGGDGTNKGGGGGGGGGPVVIVAWAVVNNGTINASGGAGGTPTTGNTGGGGGGGGGTILAYTLSAWTAGTTNVAGGTAGGHAGTGTSGTAGSSGIVLNQIVT